MIWRWIWYSLFGGLTRKIKDFFTPKKEKVSYITYESYLNSDLDIKIFEDINKYRDKQGLIRLRLDTSRVVDIAANHSKYLEDSCLNSKDFKQIGHNYFEERVEQIQLDYPGCDIGENLSFNLKNPVTAWIKSETHRKNLEGDYTHLAISTVGRICVTIYTKR